VHILTRRVGASVIIQLPIGEPIAVTVVGIKGNQVRLATDAPRQLPMVREESLEESAGPH
jgi:carbon storage regulator